MSKFRSIGAVLAVVILCPSWAYSQSDKTWESLGGPYHAGGNFYDFVRKPDGAMFAASAGSGVHRSADGGKTWAQVNTGLSDLDVYALALTPDGGVLCVTLGNAVWSSDDNGGQWQEHSLGIGSFAARSVAATAAGTWLAATTQGIMRSTDRGATWAASNAGITETSKRGRAFLISGQTIYAAIRDRVYRSTDDGRTWAGGAARISGDTLQNQVFRLALGASGEIYATGLVYPELVMSADGGNTWTSVRYNLPFEPGDALSASPTGIAADANGNLAVSLHGVNREETPGGVYVLPKGATSWVRIRHPALDEGGVWTLYPHPDGTLFAGHWKGIFRRGAGQWQQSATTGYGYVDGILKRGSELLALADGRIYRYGTSTGDQFTAMTAPSDSLLFLQGDTEYGLIFTGDHNRMWYSTDFGATWEATDYPVKNLAGHGFLNLNVTRGAAVCLLEKDEPNYPQELYYSDDRGAAWRRITPPGATSIPGFDINWDGMWAGTDAGVFYSADRGATWTAKNNGLPADETAFGVGGTGNILYAAVSDGNIYTYSPDETWKPLGAAERAIVGGARINRVVTGSTGDAGSSKFVGLVSDDNTVFIAYEGHFRKLPDFPFFDPEVTSLAIDVLMLSSPKGGGSVERVCIAGTAGMGIYTTRPVIIGGVADYIISGTKAYPDPALDRITITAGQTRGGAARLDVFAPTGALLLTANEEIGAGEAAVSCGIAALPAGIYGYRLTLPEGIYAGRFAVVR